jgi:hypothetical protein
MDVCSIKLKLCASRNIRECRAILGEAHPLLFAHGKRVSGSSTAAGVSVPVAQRNAMRPACSSAVATNHRFS